MNHDLWSDHQAALIRELRAELERAKSREADVKDTLRRVRSERDRQRRRAEYWAVRALTMGKRSPVPMKAAVRSRPGKRFHDVRDDSGRWASRESA
jgi:hypothetical protein